MEAWIEIIVNEGGLPRPKVASVWRRGLKSSFASTIILGLRRLRMEAWIEIKPITLRLYGAFVASVWRRGLKWDAGSDSICHSLSPPYGGVD